MSTAVETEQSVATGPVIKALPPGPRFASVSMFEWMRSPERLFAKCARQYGDPFTLPYFKGINIACTADPEGVRQIFMQDPDTYEVLDPDNLATFVGPKSLLVLNGQRHKRERQMMSPPFHGARMRAYAGIMRDISRRHGERLRKGEPFVMQELTQSISLEVIIQAVFGVVEPERVAVFEKAVLEYIAGAHPMLLFFGALRREFGGVGPWARFKRAETALHKLIFDEIAARRAHAAEREDILSMLLAARFDDGSAMPDESLRDELLTLLAAGHETTASSLAWAFYWLHKNPDVLAKLHDELAPLGPHPDAIALTNLKYLEAVCSETLRLHPIVADVPRQLRKPMVLRGYEIPAGHAVAALTALTHYREDLYPEPRRFRPERFLERKFSPHEYLPFGGGVRRCLGAAFAVFEMKIALGTLLMQHRYALLDGDLQPRLRNVTWGPETGVRMRVV